MCGHKQNVVVQEQTKLAQIEVKVLDIVMDLQSDDIRIISAVSVLQKQQILNVCRIHGAILRLCGISRWSLISRT